MFQRHVQRGFLQRPTSQQREAGKTARPPLISSATAVNGRVSFSSRDGIFRENTDTQMNPGRDFGQAGWHPGRKARDHPATGG